MYWLAVTVWLGRKVVGGVAVGIALAVGVARVFCALAASRHVCEGAGAGIGQRLILLTQDPDKHDQGLQTGGGHLQIIALSIAGEAALEQVHGLEGGGHGVVVRGAGIAGSA